MPELATSVSNIDLFRTWRENEELDQDWLLSRLRGEVPQTEEMKAGEALHKALENLTGTGETSSLEANGYQFGFSCDATVELQNIVELSVEKQYGPLLVRGRVDALSGLEITDYKTTGRFDADRLMESYQWRFYLDMLSANHFHWVVFELETWPNSNYCDIWNFHELRQERYPSLHEDCVRLAAEFASFLQGLDDCGIPWRRNANGR